MHRLRSFRKACHLTIPNALSLLRICLIPSIAYFLYAANYNIALALFLLIALSDALDGIVARKLNQVSSLGKMLDPLADKILVIIVLLVLVDLKMAPLLAVMIIIIRDLTISLYRGIAASKSVVVAANLLGKAKTFLQVIAIGMLIIKLPYAVETLWLTVIVTVLSGAQIIWQGREVLKS